VLREEKAGVRFMHRDFFEFEPTHKIVLVTNSYLESADRELARRAGASDLVLRTPELREVLTALERCLGRHIAAGSRPVPLDPALDQERVGRMMNQLERQVYASRALTRSFSK